MPSLENAFGIHELALKLRASRTELLASNLANADTPGFKARDIDFQAALRQAQSGQGPSTMKTTHSGHLRGVSEGPEGSELLYRVPLQPSIDGNTVDGQVEKAAFMENSINYQATMTFIDGKMKALKKALGGQ